MGATGMKIRFLLMLIGVIGVIALSGMPAQAQCDRQCLENMMKDYLAAMVKHDPSALPFASNARFTENTDKSIEVLPIGKGLWETASAGPGGFQIYAADPVEHSAACLVIMKENNKDIYLGARIKLNEEGRITEAEHIVVRNFTPMPTLQKPRPGFLQDVPKAEQMKHWDLVGIGLSYYDALTGEDGTLAPFAKECERHENGMITAGGAPTPNDQQIPGVKLDPAMAKFPRDCTGQLSTGTFAYITEVKPRRLVVADVQKGIAVGFSMFYHAGNLKVMKIKGVPGVTEIPAFAQKFNLPAIHFFKIREGQIYEIEAIGVSLPYGVSSNWE
jgi:hypothetical protein